MDEREARRRPRLLGRRDLISRLGNAFHAPDWFLDGLPEVPLDGELWVGRKAFQRTVSIVRRQDKSEHWKEVAFVVFDAPALDAPFEDRLAFVRDHAERRRPPHFRAHEHAPLRGPRPPPRRAGARRGAGRRGPDAAPARLALRGRPLDDAAQGQELPRRRGAGGRTPARGRAGTRAGSGRCSWSCPTARGSRSAPASPTPSAAAPPPIGRSITFRYQELSDGGVPRFPSYVGVRDDVALAGGRIRSADGGYVQRGERDGLGRGITLNRPRVPAGSS